MAEHHEAKGGMEAFLETLKKEWPFFVALIIGYLAINYNVFALYLYKIFLAVIPVVSVVVLGYIAWKLWVHYIQQDFISGINFVLLEIVPPRDVLRSPKAMELFFTNALYHWSMKGGKEEYWQGAVWLWFSLEIVSIEGQVHFYIRTPTRVRELIETQMYAQYPQAQVKVVEDYTLAVDEISPTSDWNGWGCEFALRKPEAYPIKTYADFGLDKDPKEELKVDPISPVIELFGSIRKGEQMWMQIVVTPSKKAYHTEGTFFGKHNWVVQAQHEMEKLLAPYTRYNANALGGGYAKEIRPPKFLDAIVDAMTRKVEKIGFDAGIRVMYIAKKEAFNISNRRNIRLIFRQYAKPNCNEFERTNSTQADAYGGILTLSEKKVMHLAERMLHEYRERGFFHLPLRHHLFSEHATYMHWPISLIFMAYKHPPTYVLNTEELATLWHFPGQILKVPTLERIESKESAPPTNLPV